MTNSPDVKTDTAATPASGATPVDARANLLKEISAKWNKLSEQDVSSLKSREDLVTQIVAKYSIDKGQAQRDADSLIKGRSFQAS